jgi:hypothetical protein
MRRAAVSEANRRHCLVAIVRRDIYNEGRTKHLKTMITMNNKATRIAEAIAKPGAARPEHTTAV